MAEDDANHLLEIRSLPPRLRAVLDELLAGHSAKVIAAKLGLSLHTVHEYTKRIYRRLGVGSRGELLAAFLKRPS